jgi:hypothetical protein
LHICTFILLKLSGERSFSVALNKPYTLKLPINLPLFSGKSTGNNFLPFGHHNFKGNHADLLVITLHKLVVNGLDKLQALYNCFLTIVCNVSPYCKSLSNVCSANEFTLLSLLIARSGGSSEAGQLV